MAGSDIPLSTQAPLHPSLAPDYTPGSGATYAHDWSPAGTGGTIRLRGRHFVDAYGRVCTLHGVNLSGNCKIPVNHTHDRFPHDHAAVTFVGRPFPLDEAPQHFARIRRWGLSLVRFVITWEAVEHAGLGIYDTEYLSYVRSLLSLLPEYGLVALVDLHQDVWSRYSGGSGAPAWTLEAIGFDLHALEESGAAWLRGVCGGGHVEAERGVWATGHQKLAAATMVTCFWGGDTFAPNLAIPTTDGKTKPVQQFLQDAFLDMYAVVVEALGDLDAVLGFEFVNEPHRGYIDLPSLYQFNYNTDLHFSHVPSALQSFMLGTGYPTLVGTWTRSFPPPTRRTANTLLNSESQNVWRVDGPTGGRCVWEMHGVWRWDTVKKEGVVLRESYFTKHPMTGHETDWYKDFCFPFLKRWAQRIHDAAPGKMLLVEPIPNELCPPSWTKENQVSNMVFAPHWYDLDNVFSKKSSNFTVNVQDLSRGMFPLRAFYWGQTGARDNYSRQIGCIVQAAHKNLGDVPVLLGECGVPMDVNDREACITENWMWQARMMDAVMVAVERSLVSFALWHYDPTSTDDKGDNWNGEDFSWFSQRRALPASLLEYEQSSFTLDNGGRILRSIVRPYLAKTAGVPHLFECDVNAGAFVAEWDTVPVGEKVQGQLRARETEIFLPSLITHGRKLVVKGLESGDKYEYDEARQTLFVVHAPPRTSKANDSGVRRVRVEVSVWPPLRPAFVVNSFWDDFSELVLSGLVVLLGVLLFFIFRAPARGD